MIFSLDPDVEKVLSNPEHPYGKCVYQCDNNVPDNQVVNMLFANNAVAQLNITAFSNEIHRNIKIHGTKGEIEGDLEAMIAEAIENIEIIELSCFKKYFVYQEEKFEI
jgi:predicted dehydrogenase